MVIGAAFDQKKSDLLDGAFAMLEEYLTRSTMVAGNDLSIADISVLVTVSMAEVTLKRNIDILVLVNYSLD